jgi:hypothetical protein
MTYREKLTKERPDNVGDVFTGGCCACPGTYWDGGPILNGDGRCDLYCKRCWDQEIPSDEHQRQFSTGAVRDDATGKGRFDLLPWGAIHALAQHCERGAIHYGERNVDKGIPQHSLIDSGLRHLGQYIQGDAEPHHLVAALWNIAWAVEQEIKRPEMIDLPERTEKSGSAI